MLETNTPRRLRGLKIVIERLEREQSADMRAFDELYDRSDELLLQITERNEELRRLREIMLGGGKR